MKNNLNAIFFALAIIIAAVLIGNAYKSKWNNQNEIVVTGLGEQVFTSDLVVWEGSFIKENKDLKQAYNELDNDKKVIEEYLTTHGVKSKDIVFKAVETHKNTKAVYATNGNYVGEDFQGYILSQSVQISSKEVVKIEALSRSITELLNKGIQFYSEPPRYYYTGLSDLKLELVSKATDDARKRAEKISEMSGARIGKLKNAQMGIFQITGEHSDEEYSWGGTFNTSSKEKKASITMKLTYCIK